MRGKIILFSFIYISFSALAHADPLLGDKQISLLDSDGGRTLIGRISFAAKGDNATYEIDLSQGPFTDHFLSMRPFRCLEGPQKHWCYVAYPYTIRREVSAGDLTDLEYDLLFLHKGATEYGIDMWNGVYYRLSVEGDRLVGEMHEMDMGLLSAPPDAGDHRPLKAKHLHEADPDSHWLPGLVIE